MLCSLFERMRRGNTYGGTYRSQHVPMNTSLALRCMPYLGHSVASHNHTQSAKIHDSKCTLSDENVRSFVRNQVESIIDE